MRIISKYTDYYDSIQHYGQDSDIIYIRNKVYPEEKFKLNLHQFTKFKDSNNITHNFFGSYILGFCGKLYIGEVIQKTESNNQPYPFKESNTSYICNYISNEDELKLKVPRYNHINMWGHPGDIEYNNIFNNTALLNLFHKYSTPCFVISNNSVRRGYHYKDNPTYKYNLTINPQLKKYQFYKIMDPYTTFQEISMYISGVLPNPGNKMVEISDRDMAIKKGFGHPYAFRKEPTKRGK